MWYIILKRFTLHNQIVLKTGKDTFTEAERKNEHGQKAGCRQNTD